MKTIRHVFQPREEIEVPDQEADVLEAQGLLWKGSDADLAKLLADDPTGPLDPPRVFTPTGSGKTATAPAATAAPAKES